MPGKDLKKVLVVLSVVNNMPLVLPLSVLDCGLKGMSLLY
jgi:hypothetical protein